MRRVRAHPSVWLLAWCLMWWAAPVQASWEAYQRAGEAAYNRGDYTEAERLLLAAVREARHLGPDDPRLDISLNKLALLRIVRDQHGQAQVGSRPAAKPQPPVHQGQTARQRQQRPAPHLAFHKHQRTLSRTGLQRAQPSRSAAHMTSLGKQRAHVSQSTSRLAQRCPGQPQRTGQSVRRPPPCLDVKVGRRQQGGQQPAHSPIPPRPPSSRARGEMRVKL